MAALNRRTLTSIASHPSSVSNLTKFAGQPFLLLTILACLFGSLIHAQTASHAPQLDRNFGKVPLNFEPNRGQVAPQVQFLSRGQGYALFLTPGEAVLQLDKGETASATLRMKLVGADATARAQGDSPLPGRVNYFIGNDPKKWQTAIETYKRVQYTGVYPGIDLVYYGNQRELEYDFLVAPHADAKQIALTFTGATPRIDATGDLVLSAATGETRFHKPLVYQLDGDRRSTVDARYEIAGGKVTFTLGGYDHAKELVIDPVLSYLTYLGGSANDDITAIAVDTAGSAYVVGTTQSLNFPTQNAYQSISPAMTAFPTNSMSSIFVTKFNATGTGLVYSTYLGSNGNTRGYGIAVDPSGSAYVGGFTDTGGYPITTGAFQPICGAGVDQFGNRVNGCAGAGQGDDGAVLTKLSPSGTSLGYSTYLGGNDYTQINAVAVNAAGEAYVTGITNSFCASQGYHTYQCFPTTLNAVQPGTANPSGGGIENFAFFTKFNAAGSALVYSSLLGNTAHAQSAVNGLAIAVDAAGNGYIAGSTSGGTLLTTPGSFQPTAFATTANPAFIAKFDPAAGTLVYSTYLGDPTTTVASVIHGIAVDAAGNAYVAGSTQSCSFPVTPGVYQPQASYPPGTTTYCTAGFVSKLNPAGSALVWSTFVGNNPGANAYNNASLAGIAVATDGTVYVAGLESGYGIQTVNPVLPQAQNSTVGYVAHLDATASTLLFATTIGGTVGCTEPAVGIAIDPAGNMYVAGVANGCTTLPTTPGAFQATGSNPGANIDDGWVAKIAPTVVTTTTLTLPAGTVTAGQAATFTAKVAGPTGTTAIPTGTVTFLSGSTTLGTGTLDATGTATYTATSLNATTYTVTASYPGSATFSSSVSAPQTLVVSPAAATITLTAPATAAPGASVTLSVKVAGSNGTPTGTVMFKDGATILSTVTLASGAASYTTTALALGSHTLTVSYVGDSIFGAATSSAQTLVVSLTTASVALTVPATAVVGASVTLSAAVTGTGGTPTGTVTFKDGTTTLSTVTLASGSASYSTSALAAGAHSITATYSGDSTFSAATSSASTLTVSVPAGITFTATTAAITIVRGGTGTAVITGTPVGGYTGTATFSCGALPAGASCSFSPASLTFTGNNTAATTTLTFATTTTTGALHALPFGPMGGGVVLALLFLPFGLRRRRTVGLRLAALAVLIIGSASMMGLAGCGGAASPTTVTTPAGTYTVPVIITAGASSSTVNLSVTVQ